jgi:hypothetical protein
MSPPASLNHLTGGLNMGNDQLSEAGRKKNVQFDPNKSGEQSGYGERNNRMPTPLHKRRNKQN